MTIFWRSCSFAFLAVWSNLVDSVEDNTWYMKSNNFHTSVQLILQASLAGTPHNEAVLSLGNTPTYLLEIGFPSLELQIKASVIDKAHFDHGVSKGILQRLGDVLNSPKALYKSATVINTAVVVTLEQKNGNPLLVPIHPDKQVGRYRVNVISSIYSKDNWSEVEPQWVEKGLLLWKRNIP